MAEPQVSSSRTGQTAQQPTVLLTGCILYQGPHTTTTSPDPAQPLEEPRGALLPQLRPPLSASGSGSVLAGESSSIALGLPVASWHL